MYIRREVQKIFIRLFALGVCAALYCMSMDEHHKVNHRTNLRLKVNIFSKLFLCWMFPYLSYGKSRELKAEDIFQLAPENRSEVLGNKLEKCWVAEVEDARRKQRRPSFLKAIVKTYDCDYLKCAVFAFISNFTFMSVPVVLKLLMAHLDGTSTSTTQTALFYIFLFAFNLNLQTLLEVHSRFSLIYLGRRVQTACSALIYNKILRLPIHNQGSSDGGKIITLLSNDVARFEEAFIYLHLLPAVPIVIIMNAILVWRLLGVTSLFMILLVTLQIPFYVMIAHFITKFRVKTAQKTDRRLLLMSEIINGIRVIKMYTWEKPFEQFALLIRRMELKPIAARLNLINGLKEYVRISMCTTIYLTITIMISYEDKVTSLIIFPLMQYNYNLIIYCGLYFTKCFVSIGNSAATVYRIENFLLTKEVAHNSNLRSTDKVRDEVLTIKNVSVSSSECDNNIILSNISINIFPNKLYALVGDIGSGKSTLLKLILGELKPQTGQVFNYGDISYANQEPWLFNASIRSNILFGESFNEEKYNKVISCCALVKDFEHLSHGDKTIVGEQGSNISGGQRARINLARAIYRNANVYLLDDPFASVDYYVGKFIFENCIKGFLKSKVIILTTQKLELIKQVDEIILISNGRLHYQGDYTGFQNTDFFQCLLKTREFDTVSINVNERRSDNSIPSFVTIDNTEENEDELNETDEFLKDYNQIVQLKHYKDPEENIEQIKQGRIPLTIIKEFYKNKSLIFGVIICWITSDICYGGYDSLIAKWVHNQEQYFASINSTLSNHLHIQSSLSTSQISLFYIIGVLIATMTISSIASLLLHTKLHKISSERLHANMISSLLKAVVKFFYVNDSGRILNRFSQDLDAIDEEIALSLITALKMVSLLILVTFQIAMKSPYTSIIIAVSFFLVFKLYLFFIKCIRSLKRLEVRAKASVLSHSNATLNGLETIRSFGAQAMVQQKFTVQQDNYMAACFTNTDMCWMSTLWIAIVTNFIYIFIACFFLLLKAINISISSATIGFIMFQMHTSNIRLKSTLEYIAIYESRIVSMERALEYTKLNQENMMEKECPIKYSASTWPSVGRIKFNNLYLKYSNSIHPVLKNINLVIEPGAKIGIIGRTGAGKSSLIAALLRLADVEGSIVIDGVDVRHVMLKDLRNSINVLPQKPILFSTSLRNNLDPLNLFDDVKIWAALRMVRLDDMFESLDEELDHESLSNGQQQLLCLTRVILKKNKILILDEATANVDSRTGNLIYSIIKENFVHCTVLIITHKLNTVIDCDKILVVDEGEVIEYEEPRVLLNRKNGYLYKILHAFTEDV